MTTITVNKMNPQREVTYRYQGRLLHRDATTLVIEAIFDRHDMQFDGLFLGKGDRFVETYYTDRWYNFFEVHSREDDSIRGWYCNIGLPVEVDGDSISYIDLALDLVVLPDGRQSIIDQDEFDRLEIPAEVRARALDALAELQAVFHNR